MTKKYLSFTFVLLFSFMIAEASAQKYNVNFKNVPMKDFIAFVSDRAGKNGIKFTYTGNIAAVIEKNNGKYSVLPEGGNVVPINSLHAGTPQSAGINMSVSIKRSEIKEELKDLNNLLQSALVSPFSQYGELVGYRITRLKDDSPLKKLGFNQGDIITRINGGELKSPEILFNMMVRIDEISSVSIDMIRNNDKKTLFVELQ